MKTVYPSVIHSAISSPKNSTGATSSNLYVSPDDSSSNTRNSNKEEVKSNAIGISVGMNLQKKIQNPILSPKNDPKSKRMIIASPKSSATKHVMGKRSFSNASNNRLLNRNRYQRHSRLNNYLNFQP